MINFRYYIKIFEKIYGSFKIPIGVFTKEGMLKKLFADFGERLTYLYLGDCAEVLNFDKEKELVFFTDSQNLGWVRIVLENDIILLGPVLFGSHLDFAYSDIPQYTNGVFMRIGKHLCDFVFDEQRDIDTIVSNKNMGKSIISYMDDISWYDETKMHENLLNIINIIRDGDVVGVKELFHDEKYIYAMEIMSADLSFSRISYIHMLAIYYSQAVAVGAGFTETMMLLKKYTSEIGKYQTPSGYTAAMGRALYDFTNLVNRIKNERKHSALISKAIFYIEEHIYTEFDFEELARYCSYSISALRNRFKKETGMPMKDYIKKRKMDRACFFLKYTSLSCTDISYKLGYCTQSYFIKQFKEVMGTTPQVYRADNT